MCFSFFLFLTGGMVVSTRKRARTLANPPGWKYQAFPVLNRTPISFLSNYAQGSLTDSYSSSSPSSKNLRSFLLLCGVSTNSLFVVERFRHAERRACLSLNTCLFVSILSGHDHSRGRDDNGTDTIPTPQVATDSKLPLR